MDQNTPQKWFNLEDQFFNGLDSQLLSNLREQAQIEESAESIMKLTGITDKKVAEKIAGLKVSQETLAAFCLVPLVAVAWANDSVNADEKWVIDQAAKSAGLDENCMQLLEGWLKQRPGSELLNTWCEYSKALASEMNEPERDALREHIVSQATAVAKSSGGVLGIGAVSPNEKATLEKIKAALA